PFVLISLLLWAAAAVVFVRAFRRDAPLFVAIGWFFVTLLPVSNLLFAIGVGKAERILYLPSAGFCLAIGAVTARAVSRVKRPLLVFAAFAPALALLLARTVV